MAAPASPGQIANGLDAWAKSLHRTVASDAARDMRRAAALIREQQETIRTLEKDLSDAHDVIIAEQC